MANPDKLAVTKLTANGYTAQPAGSVIDSDGTVPIVAADYGGATDRLLIEVTCGAARDTTVTINHGDNPPAVRESLGDLSQLIAQNAVGILGPFEAARFIQDDGTIRVTFDGDNGAATATVRTYLLPKAV